MTRLPPHCAQISYQRFQFSAKPVNAPYYRKLGVKSVPLPLELPKLEHTGWKLIQISDRKGITFVNAGGKTVPWRPCHMCVLPDSTCRSAAKNRSHLAIATSTASPGLSPAFRANRDRTRTIRGRRLCHCSSKMDCTLPFPALPATFRLGFQTFPSGSSGTADIWWHCI